MRYNKIVGLTSLLVSMAVSADPCLELCFLIPGACDAQGSFCVGDNCSDLYWMTPSTICNPSTPGCRSKRPVSCNEAEMIVASGNADNLSAHVAASVDMVTISEIAQDVSFADATQAGGVVRGRKGIHNLGATCYLASALQVVLHSRSVRDAVRDDLLTGEAPLGDPVYLNFVMLLQRMYDPSSDEPLNLRNLLDALHLYNDGNSFENSSDDSFQSLMVLFDSLSRASPRIANVVISETSGTRLCTACEVSSELAIQRQGYELVRFPGSARQYSIPEMLRAHFGVKGDLLGCGGLCRTETEHVVRPIISKLPQLLTISVFRYSETEEKISTSLDQPLEIDMAGIVEGGEEIRYRLVGVIRHMGGHYLLDYLDTDTNEWIHSNDLHLHVIQGRPRNGGADPLIVFYERI